MSVPPNSVANDWQLSLDLVKDRGAHILTTAAWSDCSFLVGNPPVTVPAHRLFLAMASPVFEAMLYGPMAEGNKPIAVEDISYDGFKSMLEYIYSDKVNTKSIDATCELYYAAKKYMLNRLAIHCELYLRGNVTTPHVCHVYEIAECFEEKALAETCLRKMETDTQSLLHESGFEQASIQTVQKIFSLKNLSIASELVLLQAAERYAQARGVKRRGEEVHALANKRVKTEDENYVNMGYVTDDDGFYEDHGQSTEDKDDVYEGIRGAVKQIRFLSLTPQQFASRVAGSPLLEPDEALNLLVTLTSNELHMPEGFSLETTGRGKTQKTNAKPNDQPPAEGRAECIVEYTIWNFRTRKRRICSDLFYVNAVPYRLEFTPHDSTAGKMLLIDVACRGENLDEQYMCRMNGTVKVVNQMNAQNHLVLPFRHTFTRSQLYGATRELTWAELTDPFAGLLHSNTLVFEVHVIADLTAAELELTGRGMESECRSLLRRGAPRSLQTAQSVLAP